MCGAFLSTFVETVCFSFILTIASSVLAIFFKSSSTAKSTSSCGVFEGFWRDEHVRRMVKVDMDVGSEMNYVFFGGVVNFK